MNRSSLIHQLNHHIQPWDVIVIGGGATGAGIAFDAVARGYDTLLLEQEDFGKGTSSRSTKLIHGGVRYLNQGDLVLVFEALRERGLILKNAPHVTFNQQFAVPVYTVWDAMKYTIGLKFYDLLSGKLSLGKSKFINREKTLTLLPGLNQRGLKGSIIYRDGQFDDSRLLINLIQSVNHKGGIALNYFRVNELIKNHGQVEGVIATNMDTHESSSFYAKVVINATGVFSDDIMKMDQPVIKRTIRPSQGIHLVLKRSFLPGSSSVMIPKTEDGRVLFAIPWYNHVVMGTTDTPVEAVSLEPRALEDEIDFILHTASSYFNPAPERKDVLTVFAGLRPLVANPDDPTATRELSRRHKISISLSGLVNVEGGKWTIYRKMAEDTLDKVIRAGMLKASPCGTMHMPVFGADSNPDKNDRLYIYGTNRSEIIKLEESDPALKLSIHPELPYTRSEVIWICRNEMPFKLEDVLARRTRALFLNAAASIEMAPEVAGIMAHELGFDSEWIKRQLKEYEELAKEYRVTGDW